MHAPSILSRATTQVLVLFLLCVLGVGVHAAPAPEVPPVTTTVQVHSVITEGFTHPGIGLTEEILERARSQVIAGKEPWLSYYREMAQSRMAAREPFCRNESKERPGYPDVDSFENRGMQARLEQDGTRAQTQALMYFFTGDEVYRANALRNIRVWSRMDPTKFRYYSDAHIHTGWSLRKLLTAAEILRYTSSQTPELEWTDADTDRLTNNLINPMIRTFMDSNGWFMNQNLFAINGALSGFIFTNNRKGYDQRVEWFTMNRNAPNHGWDGSIQRLARLVDTNALTGEKVADPQVQLVELGRDGAHAAEDVNLFVNITALLMAQGTRVDPVTGERSTAPDAVDTFEFLDHRILAVADFACRYMLGHPTRWIPVAHNQLPDGTVRGIYPRLSDQYRGRMTTFGFWQLYFHYKYNRGVDVSKAAPFLHEAMWKRIAPLDWLYLPVAAEREGSALLLPPVRKGIVPLARRVTLLSEGAEVIENAESAFVRLNPTSDRTVRFAILSAATRSKTLALRVRTDGVALMKMQGFKAPWILPDTKGQWAHVTVQLGEFEELDNIVFIDATASTSIQIDLEELVQDAAELLQPPSVADGEPIQRWITYVGAPVELKFAPASPGAQNTTYRIDAGPTEASIEETGGTFRWTPERVGAERAVVVVTGKAATVTRQVEFQVEPNFAAAVSKLRASYGPLSTYETPTRKRLESANRELSALTPFSAPIQLKSAFMEMHTAVRALRPINPLLEDGSLDYVRTAVSPDAGKTLASLADGNDDTFPVYTLASDRNYTLDFGETFRVSVQAFSIEGRLNFEDRAAGTVLYGSNDGENWIPLTKDGSKHSLELMRIEVEPARRKDRYRYLRIQKTTGGLFEPCELRLHATRHEVR